MVLCAPVFGLSTVTTSPFIAFTTVHVGPSSDGTYRILPSGESAMRSQPPSYALSHTFLPLTISHAPTRLIVLTYTIPVFALAAMPLTFSASCPAAGASHVGMRRTGL